MKHISALSGCACLAASLASAVEYHVAPNGSDTNPGSSDAPFATLQRAVAVLKPGDVCRVRAGRYALPVVLKGLHGDKNRPISIVAAEGEEVILDGTDAIRSEWVRHQGNIYKTRLEADIWQLFHEDQMMTTARWPNAHMTDENFYNQKETWRQMSPESVLGVAHDKRPAGSAPGRADPEDEGSQAGFIRDGVNMQSLAQTGIDFTGGIAVMNIFSWRSYASVITKHAAGDSSFTYDKTFAGSGSLQEGAIRRGHDTEFWNAKNRRGEQAYYFIEGLMCLDMPREWYYLPSQNTLYFHPPDGRMPAPGQVRGKRRIYMLVVENCSHLAFRGLNFFGATFSVEDSTHIAIEDSRLLYPNYSKRVLGDFDQPQHSQIINRDNDQNTGNRLVNCRFEFMDGPALLVKSGGTLIENCLFHDVDYSCMGYGQSIVLDKQGTVIRRCTLYRSGGAEGIRGGTLCELNHVFQNGGLQHDGSAFQTSGREGVILRYNWVHDTPKFCYRFDSGKNPKAANGSGQVLHNVAWNCKSIQIKGDDHLIANNVVTGFPGEGINLNTAPIWLSTNERTVTANNLTSAINGKPQKPAAPPGRLLHNRIGNATEFLRDPENWDFRPRDKSSIIDAGQVISIELFSRATSLKYLGLSPDIGAYEFGDEHYWIPGFQYPHASTPVPPDGSTTVKPDADLMWLEGYRAASHDVYLGTNAGVVAGASKEAREFRGNWKSNIFPPGRLETGKRYFWRVDAVKPDGSITPGCVWTFMVQTTNHAKPKND